MADLPSLLLAGVTPTNNSLVLSADDIRGLVDWPAPMVEDYLNIIEALISLAGANDDVISTINELILFTAELEARVDRNEFTPVTTSADYVTQGNEFIYCTNTSPITVTLNLEPFEGETVHITQGGSNVIIDANGSTINGDSSIKLKTPSISRMLTYNGIINGWIVI